MLSIKKIMDVLYTWRKAPISQPSNLSEGKKLLILGNGPSAKEFWDNEESVKKYINHDFMCMNKAIFQKKDEIYKIRPKYFILLDPAFLMHSKNENTEEKVYVDKMISKTKEVLNNIDWTFYLVTNVHEEISIKNKNMTIIRLNRNVIKPSSETIMRLYMKNFANPGIDTVLEAAIFFGITFGYREIALVGTEFSLFKDISVDNENRLINISKHFYEEEEEDKKARYVRKEYFGFEGSAVAYYLHRMAECFNTFYYLRKYADYMKCKICNCTEDSMIDVFERKKFR